jgi:integrase
MAVYKRGGVWWYEFVFNGDRVRESTKQGNKRTAEQMEAAKRTQLAKGEVGIRDRKPAPTLKQFAPRFEQAIAVQCAEKPRTIEFYRAKLHTLLADNVLASTPIGLLDEAAIEQYVQARTRVISRRKKPLAAGSINRELATLRRLLRLAHEWKEIERVPRVRLLRGERNREFVLSRMQEQMYLSVCPFPLADIAVVLLDTGLRLGEALTLEWPQVRITPVSGAKFGYLTVLSGKAKNRKSRNVPLSERAIRALNAWEPKDSGYVFCRKDGSPFSDSDLDHQHAQVRTLLKMPSDFVPHSLRHTFGTRLGESGADAFTIMKLMGHSSVTVSQRYVHPSPESIERAFERLIAANPHSSVDEERAKLEANLQDVPTKVPTVELSSTVAVQ